jgi:hypothetical protein
MLMGNASRREGVDMATRTTDTDVELDELDDDVTEEEGAAKAQEVTFGVRDLAEYLSKKTGKTIKPKDLRTLLRKMAREDKPRVNREVIPGNRSRYDWPNGLKDPEVQRVIKAVVGGELEAGKKEALDALKARKGKTKKEKVDEAVEELDDELEDELDADEDILSDEEV